MDKQDTPIINGNGVNNIMDYDSFEFVFIWQWPPVDGGHTTKCNQLGNNIPHITRTNNR